MNKNTGTIIGIVSLVVIVGGVFALKNPKNDEVTIAKDTDNAVVMEKENMEKDQMINEEEMEHVDTVEMDDSKMKADDTMKEMLSESMIIKMGSYETYSPLKLSRAETGDVVLFFHASWCPSCRGLNADIEANLSAIPEGVSILKVDYDTQTELKKKYGVTYQHTLVQVDKDGNQIKKWSGSPKLASLLGEIN